MQVIQQDRLTRENKTQIKADKNLLQSSQLLSPSLSCSPSLPTTGKYSQNMLLVLTHSNWPWSQGTGWHFNACKESIMLDQGN